ncbi:MAG: dihydroorotate dehydrogenase electron transfer subunit [Firmicutes bacterium]|nr:dihydroorotate dehydrogenase electron transfer subunit [Bacillota bacterium]
MTFQTERILTNTEIAPDIFYMTVYAPEIAAVARAGQFAMLNPDRSELLLPRPISICDVDRYELRFVYQVVGAGTKAMSQMQVGSYVKILAPLGKGFFAYPQKSTLMSEELASTQRAISNLENVAIVGGGIGTPPLLYLAKTLKFVGAKVDAYLGFRSNPILLDEFKSIVDNLHIATEDGSVGHMGDVLQVLQKENQIYDEIFACGPRPMLGALAKYARSKEIPCQVSMEERMACGLGTCVGCVLEIGSTYLRICTEGPVFYSDKINWEY